MSDVNPYAYTEEPDFVFPKQHGSRTGEPALPLNMSLVHKTGVFSSRLCQMSVTEDQIEISGMHLEEPVTIQRHTARDQVKLRLLDMKIRDDNGRKHRMKYPKTDPEKYLTLARLEAWLDPDLTDDPETAQQCVDNRLKKWTCCMVTNWITCLLVLQILALIIVVIGCVVAVMSVKNGDDGETMIFMIVVLGWVGFLVASNITFLVLLRFGQMWALYLVIMLYSLFCLVSLIGFNPVGILIGGAMIYQSVKARSDYIRLSPQVGGYL